MACAAGAGVIPRRRAELDELFQLSVGVQGDLFHRAGRVASRRGAPTRRADGAVAELSA